MDFPMPYCEVLLARRTRRSSSYPSTFRASSATFSAWRGLGCVRSHGWSFLPRQKLSNINDFCHYLLKRSPTLLTAGLIRCAGTFQEKFTNQTPRPRTRNSFSLLVVPIETMRL